MGLFRKSKPEIFPEVNVDDDSIVAVASGRMIDISTVSDPVFAEKMMGESTAFQFDEDKVTICSPANGELAVLFPTGHAFGIRMKNGVELLVHIGIDTVNAKGDGFKKENVKQGDYVKAGQPIVTVNMKKLKKNYDMSVILIVTNANERSIHFKEPAPISRGESIIS